MTLKQEIKDLKKEIHNLTKKGYCSCGKLLFYYDENYLYVKCRHCKKINQYLLEKKIV